MPPGSDSFEHFQQKCEAVLRPEMRLKQRYRAVLPIR